MIITKELLEKHDVYKSCITFFENNFNKLDTNKIKVTGDYKGFYVWIQNLPEIKYDKNNNIILKKDPGGDIWEWEYDENNNLIWLKEPNGDSQEYKYNDNNNMIWERNTIIY